MNKKDFPIKVLEALQPFYTKNSEYYKRDFSSSGVLISFKDVDEKSKFYFNIIRYTPSQTTFMFEISYAPTSVSDISPKATKIEMSSLNSFLDLWVNLLKRYEPLKAPDEFEDPITKQYQNEFYEEFELVDEDAETTAFSTDQQIAIDNCLNYIVKQLNEARSEQNQIDVDEIVAECVELKTNQTKFTKKIVVQKFSKIFAKAKKGGIHLLKIVRDEIVKEFAKQLVKGASDNIHLIDNILP